MKPHPWMLLGPLAIVSIAAIEGLWLQRIRGHYDWRAYLTSAGDLLVRLGVGLLPLGLAGGVLNGLWTHRLYTMPLHSPWTWIILFLGSELLYYWMHRADHRVRWLWATHSVHHSPKDLNLAAAYRLGFTARLSLSPLFFAPLVWLGFPPLAVTAALGLNLLYQFWLHAPWIGRAGWLEWVFNTPSHHRIHHASNPEYLDANFGGVLIVFDRVFGTFRESAPGVRIRYGLADPLDSYNPLRVGLREWARIGRDLIAARSLKAVAVSVLGPPPGPKHHPAPLRASAARHDNAVP